MLQRCPGNSVHSFEVIGIDLSPVQIGSADVAFSAPTLGEIHGARVNGGGGIRRRASPAAGARRRRSTAAGASVLPPEM